MAIENVSLNMDFKVQKEAVLAFKGKRMLPKLFDMFEIISHKNHKPIITSYDCGWNIW